MADEKKTSEYVLRWIKTDPEGNTFEDHVDCSTVQEGLRQMADLIEFGKGRDMHLDLRSNLTKMSVFKWDNY